MSMQSRETPGGVARDEQARATARRAEDTPPAQDSELLRPVDRQDGARVTLAPAAQNLTPTRGCLIGFQPPMLDEVTPSLERGVDLP